MVARKKTDIVQLSKVRMREALRAKLARDAERNGVTLNAEIVERLERSYVLEAQLQRESAVDVMIEALAPKRTDEHGDIEIDTTELARRFAKSLGFRFIKTSNPQADRQGLGRAAQMRHRDIASEGMPDDSGSAAVSAATVADHAIGLAGALRRDLESLEKERQPVSAPVGSDNVIHTATLASRVKEIIISLQRDLAALESTTAPEKERSD